MVFAETVGSDTLAHISWAQVEFTRSVFNRRRNEGVQGSSRLSVKVTIGVRKLSF